RRCSGLRCRCRGRLGLQWGSLWHRLSRVAAAGSRPEEISIHRDCCEYPCTLLLVGTIGAAANHFSDLEVPITVSVCRNPVTFPVSCRLPEWERSRIMLLAMPKPPRWLKALPSASEANSSRAAFE